MTATGFLALALGAWVLCGLVLAFGMARRGHSGWTWWLLGVFFGPIAALFALTSIRQERDARPMTFQAGSDARGPVDVLAGIDGSPESVSAIRKALEIVGSQIGRLTLATVVDYDVVVAGFETIDQAEAMLADVSASVTSAAEPQTIILLGRPAEALMKHAIEGNYDLLVAGTRGRGITKALLGSVATDLASRSTVPVFLAN